ncbi:hypothetical protein BGZ67_007664 [Mortierella alpina]|nr:hypothetical protein BGZ67_007664 [Mortierella alpina]
MNRAHVFSLPPEIYFVIARYLPRNDLAASVLVCKTWFLYFRSYLWQELDISRDRLHRFNNVPETALFRNAPVIQTLRTYSSVVVRTIATLGATCTNLRNFRVTAENADLDAILHLIRQNVCLQDLSLLGDLIMNEEDLLRILEALPIILSKLTLGGSMNSEDSEESEGSEDEEDQEVQYEKGHLQRSAMGINQESHVWALTSLTVRKYFYNCRALHQFMMRAPLLETLCLKNVIVLDVHRLSECLNQCPSLTTLRLRMCNDCNTYIVPEEDEATAVIIAGGCQHDWKKIDIKGNYLGYATYEALMKLAP